MVFCNCRICGTKALCPKTQHGLQLVLPAPRRAGQGDFFFVSFAPPVLPKGRKGGCTMTFEQVVLLLTLLGGAIYVTFEITWTVSHSDDKKKK